MCTGVRMKLYNSKRVPNELSMYRRTRLRMLNIKIGTHDYDYIKIHKQHYKQLSIPRRFTNPKA